jgi:hypothetical protein
VLPTVKDISITMLEEKIDEDDSGFYDEMHDSSSSSSRQPTARSIPSFSFLGAQSNKYASVNPIAPSELPIESDRKAVLVSVSSSSLSIYIPATVKVSES